jgi:Ca-activated chloride channel family protein
MDNVGTSATPNDPVAGLIDIPLPQAVSFWPATWTSRIAVALLIIGLITAVIWYMRRWYGNRYRRAALAELDGIVHSPTAESDPVSTIDRMALLVRRTALVVFPREKIAPLNGAAWLDFLDRSYAGHEFSQGAGRALGLAPYAPRSVAAGEVPPIADLVRQWIRTHHG